MKRAVSVVISVALVLSITSCFKHTYHVGGGAPDGAQVYKHWHHHWLFGLIRPEHQKNIDLAEICPTGQATIHEEVSFVNGLINALIGFIYSPTTVTIRCADGSQARLTLDEEQVRAIVSHPRFLPVVAELVPERLAVAQKAAARLRAANGLWALGEGPVDSISESSFAAGERRPAP